jgi:hypothetical protein
MPGSDEKKCGFSFVTCSALSEEKVIQQNQLCGLLFSLQMNTLIAETKERKAEMTYFSSEKVG